MSASLSDYITRVVIARKPCGGTGIFRSLRLTYPRRGTIKTIEAIFQLGPFEICLLSFFFLFYPSLIRGWSSSFPLDFSISSPLFSFFLFVFVSRVERQFEFSSRIREDPVFKGIKGDSWRTTCGDFDEPYRGFRLLIIDVTRSPLLFI